MPPEVSVVIPAFNRAHTIEAAIGSVLAQTFQNFEILVVDDGSTDGTADVVAAIKDERIRLIGRGDNKGAGAARNAGAGHSLGRWIAFQDSDDLWLPDKLSLQVERLESHPPVAAVYCGLVVVEPALATEPGRAEVRYVPAGGSAYVEGNIFDQLLQENIVGTPTLVVRRELFQELGGFDTGLRALEDWDLALRIAAAGPVGFIDHPLVVQRYSPNSVSRDRRHHCESLIRILGKYAEAYRVRPEYAARHYYNLAVHMKALGDRAGESRFIRLYLRASRFSLIALIKSVRLLALNRFYR